MEYSVLIIGLGQIGMGYDYDLDRKQYILTHARAFNEHKNFKIIGAIDTNSEKGIKFRKKYKSEFFSDVLSAKKLSPDIVIISTPTSEHTKTIKDALNYFKPKVILCDKPLAPSLNEAKKIYKLCNTHGVRLFVNYMRTSLPETLEIKKNIFQQKYKGSFKGIVWYSKGLIHNGSHFVNLISFLFGDVKKIRTFNKDHNDTNDFNVDFSLTFDNGEIFFLYTKEEFFSNYAMQINFQNGCLNYLNGGREINWHSAIKDSKLTDYKFLNSKASKFHNITWNKYQLIVVNQLENFLSGREFYLCDGNSAIKTLKIIDKITNK